MKRRVVVTGLGAVTSLSCRVADLWNRILNGESGIHPIRLFDTTAHKVKFGGDVYDWSTGDYVSAKEAKRIDRFTQFAMVAGIDAVRDSGLDFAKEDPFRAGVILGSGIGGLHEIETQVERLLHKGPDKVSAFTIPKLMINAASGHLSIQYGLRGPNHAVATACASATNAIGDALKSIQYDDADIMITGGTEAAITPMGIAGFANMRALSERNDDPPRASRPFDRDRDGFVLSEGAGMLVFEELGHAQARGARIYAEVLGYGASADGSHITQPDEAGTGAARAMDRALADGKVDPTSIGYINAHGTSTPLGDAAETVAIKRIFGEHARQLSVSSTKSQLGHMLGASGGVELLLTVLALGDGMIPPTINLDNPDPACDLDYTPNRARERRVQAAMSNSFGFGGHNATVIVGRLRVAALPNPRRGPRKAAEGLASRRCRDLLLQSGAVSILRPRYQAHGERHEAERIPQCNRIRSPRREEAEHVCPIDDRGDNDQMDGRNGNDQMDGRNGNDQLDGRRNNVAALDRPSAGATAAVHVCRRRFSPAAGGSAWRTPGGRDANSAGVEPIRPLTPLGQNSIARVTNGSGGLPNDAGQVWRDYDISPYTMRVTSTSRPEQAIVDWILLDTGYETWHSDPVGLLSANKRTLHVYHTPQIQALVADMVDRFVNSEAETHAFGLQVLTVGSPNWRTKAHRMLHAVTAQSQGVQAWLVAKEDASLILADLRRRTDFREHSSPHLLVNNGQSTVVAATQSKNYTRDIVLKPGAWPGFEPQLAQLEEGFSLEFSPLLSVDGRTIDAVIKCNVDQVEKMLPVMIDVPTTIAPRQRTEIKVPQVASCRLHERFRWPADQVLLISLGVVSSPSPASGSSSVLGLTGPARSDLLVIVESKGKISGSSTTPLRAVRRDASTYQGRY